MRNSKQVFMNLAGHEAKLALIKEEIELFQSKIRLSDGSLPKKFSYSEEIRNEVLSLKVLGLSPRVISKALGLSDSAVEKWFKGDNKKTLSKKIFALKPSKSSVVELQLRNFETNIDSKNNFDSRLLLKSGAILEFGFASIKNEIIQLLVSHDSKIGCIK